MSEKTESSFEKARDEVLRALISQGGLTPEQVSGLKLDEVQLATGRLISKPDEFDPDSTERAISLKLDETMQRALITWLVVRPDGPNDHLFPGTDLEGMDVDAINRAVSADKVVDSKGPTEPAGEPPPSHAELEQAVEAPAEPPPPGIPKVTDKAPPPAPPPSAPQQEPEAVPLDEIESLRKRLADSYDAWAPVVPAAAARPIAESIPEVETSPPPIETEPPEEIVEPAAPWEPVAPPLEWDEPEPLETAPWPEETVIAAPVPIPPDVPSVDAPVAVPSDEVTGESKGFWETSKEKVTLNLSYRVLGMGALALAVICCVGLILAGGTMFSPGGLEGLLAASTPTETQEATEAAPSATFTASPSPTPTASPTVTVGATATQSPAPTDTPAASPTLGPTSTPVVVVVTATPTPEPPATATPVPTNTPEGGTPPEEPTATPTPGFNYPAPVLLEPKDDSVVPGIINILKWEPAGPLADDEWYATRLTFLQQGQPVYAGDRVKVPEWRVPDRFYYMADGPALEYQWYVFVERENPDGSTIQLSPDSETYTFRWE